MLSVLFLTVFYSCKKDGELYPQFNDENHTVNFVDTLTIETSLVKDDSIRTDIASYNLIGLYNDSVFGLASSSVFTEVTLSGANINFGNNPIIDSLVLSLKYQGPTSFYGNLLTSQTFNVFELSEELTKDEYYSNDSISFGASVGSISFTPFVNDSVKNIIINGSDTVDYEPHLRIPINNTLGQQLLNLGAGSNTIASNSDLKSVLKGFYISPSQSVYSSSLNKGDGAIIYFDFNSSLTTLTLFYHNDTDTNSYSFIINSESKKFNRFEHNYTNTDIANHLAGSNFDSTLTYIQAMGGVKTKINIPYIKTLKNNDNNIVINKAELVFSLSDGSNETYSHVESTSLTGINEEGSAVFLVDNFEGTDYFGGSYDYDTRSYTFNISRHIQQLITSEEEDYGLYFMATGTAISANRSIINSAKHSSSPLKLKITYSKP